MINMSELKAKNMTASLVNWEAYIQKTGESIKELNEKIKDKTLDEREAMKELRKNLKAAQWKKDSILATMHEELESGAKIAGEITLDDFDVEEAEINIELTKKEFAAAQKETSEDE